MQWWVQQDRVLKGLQEKQSHVGGRAQDHPPEEKGKLGVPGQFERSSKQ